MTDTNHNPAPILDLISVVDQIKKNTVVLKDVTIISDSKKYIDQITPDKTKLPGVGLTTEFGDVSENYANSSMVQFFDIQICCTVVLDASSDQTGAGSHLYIWDMVFKDLMHCIYNWKPSKQRYVNGFKLSRFERIAALSSNAYEVYCVYFTIPAQIDYLDGYLISAKNLSSINASIELEKAGDVLNVDIIEDLSE